MPPGCPERHGRQSRNRCSGAPFGVHGRDDAMVGTGGRGPRPRHGTPTASAAFPGANGQLALTPLSGSGVILASPRPDAPELQALSCASSALCVIGDSAGDLLFSTDPPTRHRRGPPITCRGTSATSTAPPSRCIGGAGHTSTAPPTPPAARRHGTPRSWMCSTATRACQKRSPPWTTRARTRWTRHRRDRARMWPTLPSRVTPSPGLTTAWPGPRFSARAHGLPLGRDPDSFERAAPPLEQET
jgi:hypothetical protein